MKNLKKESLIWFYQGSNP